MTEQKVYRAIGLMSGTSMDGIDVALIETDGEMLVRSVAFWDGGYEQDFRARLRECLGMRCDVDGQVAALEREFTLLSVAAVEGLLAQEGLSADDIDVVGFHGHTIAHEPLIGFTWQIGDGHLLAQEIGIDVVYDFRQADIDNGGQGAPLLPLYHHRLVARDHSFSFPVALLNIGGVSNVTYVTQQPEDILGYDLGPGNALLDDFMLRRTGQEFDANGVLAASGVVDKSLLRAWMDHPYFSQAVPKSLDRDIWDVSGVDGLSDADGAATLSAFTIQAVQAGFDLLPELVKQVFVCGGGRHNIFMMQCLTKALKADVISVDALGWNGDAIEAEGFAYYAVRSLLGLPVTYPGTTGVRQAQSAGVLAQRL